MHDANLLPIDLPHPTNGLVGNSLAIRRLRKIINQYAKSSASVVIQGASGTGKELVAKAIHQASARRMHPFIPVNCAAIPNDLLESEFFGHKKGSFTGATYNKKGLFKAADSGTLFLDEVAELSMGAQGKLLRAIQEKAVRPLGEYQEHSCDVRIICATHQDLRQLVSSNLFREDLYYRLNVLEVRAPDLKDRKEDIPDLCHAILHRIAGEQTKIILSSNAHNKLMHYSYPGNVRELENILEKAIALSDSPIIQPENVLLPQSTANVVTVIHLLEQQKSAILMALKKNKWNKTAAAKELGMTTRALRYRIEKWCL